MEQFDKKNDKIALVLKEFTLKKKSEMLGKYSEPYFVSIAIDEHGVYSSNIHINTMIYPHIAKGETVRFDGTGFMIYGPKNPGEFITYSVLFLESDKAIREIGQKISNIISSEAVKIGIKTLLTVNPSISTATTVLQKLIEATANQLKKNKDDELFRQSGTLLRDINPAYNLGKPISNSNDFIQSQLEIIPLTSENSIENTSMQITLS